MGFVKGENTFTHNWVEQLKLRWAVGKCGCLDLILKWFTSPVEGAVVLEAAPIVRLNNKTAIWWGQLHFISFWRLENLRIPCVKIFGSKVYASNVFLFLVEGTVQESQAERWVSRGVGLPHRGLWDARLSAKSLKEFAPPRTPRWSLRGPGSTSWSKIFQKQTRGDDQEVGQEDCGFSSQKHSRSSPCFLLEYSWMDVSPSGPPLARFPGSVFVPPKPGSCFCFRVWASCAMVSSLACSQLSLIFLMLIGQS